jgi:hypothetical protein
MPRAFAAWMLVVAASFAAAPARAQTRLTLFGGPLVPFGDLEDVAEMSWIAGARTEFQTVNAIGQRDRSSFFIEGTYAQLFVDEAVGGALQSQGLDDSSSIFGAAVGMRVYTRPAPLFMSLGTGYAYYSPLADEEGMHGLAFQLGLGFLLPLKMFQIEAAAVAHEVLLDTERGFAKDDLQYVTATGGLSFPF